MQQRFKVRTPASCGELIQGFYGKQEMLISYPVNLFSEITFSTDPKIAGEMIGQKSEAAIDLFFQEKEVSRDLFNNYYVKIENNIPVGKGMASSTADICGVLKGLHHLYKLSITDEDLAKMCCIIEPTDSTIFKNLSLFDHINGLLVETFDWQLDCDVLILEPDYQINTTDFRKAKKEQLMRKNHDSQALALFRQAVDLKSYEKLCESTYLSAKENQEILEKPYFEVVRQIALKHKCYGVNVAHSGSIIAILLDKKIVDLDALSIELKEENCGSYYKKQYMAKIVSGGSQILEDK